MTAALLMALPLAALLLPFVFEGNFTVIMCAAAFIAILSALFSFYFCNIRVDITEEAVTFKRFGNTYKTFPLAEFNITADVEHGSYNGIPYTIRRLYAVPKAGGRRKRQRCYCFGKETFTRMMAYLASFKYAKVRRILEESNIMQKMEKAVYIIDKELLVKRHRKFFYIASAAVLLWVGVLALVFLGAFGTELSPLRSLIFFELATAGIALKYLISFALPLHRVRQNTPERIELDEDGITIDGHVFTFRYLLSVKVTPPANIKREWLLPRLRRIVITDEFGINTYITGDTNIKQPAFAEYEAFCTRLELQMINEPGKFFKELG
jgi:uncharacterized protein YxjI